MRGDPKYSPEKSIYTRSAIWRMYRDAADHDYLMARFAARSNLIYQFWWNAQQSVEKYLKAIILLNGHPTTKFKHELLDMYDKGMDIAGDLMPSVLSPPWFVVSSDQFSKSPRFKTVRDFISRVEANGDPNSRYRIFSATSESRDLIYFDELCFKLRRLAFPLGLHLKDYGMPAREWLQAHPSQQIHPQMGFQGSLTNKTVDVWQQHFEWCNFSYFYDAAAEVGEYPQMGGSINAEPFLRLQSGNKEGLHSIRWVAVNSFPSTIGKEINREVEKSLSSKVS